MHGQLGLIWFCDVNYGRFAFLNEKTLSVILWQIQGVVSESDFEQLLPALSSCAHCGGTPDRRISAQQLHSAYWKVEVKK